MPRLRTRLHAALWLGVHRLPPAGRGQDILSPTADVAVTLATLVEHGHLSESAAADIGRALFWDNPAALYRLAP